MVRLSVVETDVEWIEFFLKAPLGFFVRELLFHVPINRSLTISQPAFVLLLRFPFFQLSVFVLDQPLLCLGYALTLAAERWGCKMLAPLSPWAQSPWAQVLAQAQASSVVS